MASESREIEFKFGVAGRQAFSRLLQHLQLPESLVNSGIKQTNHFFDSAALCLRKHHFVIRLREAGGTYALTIKGERSSATTVSGTLSNRVEEEVMVPESTADALLTGRLAPRRAISEHFGDRSSALLKRIDDACRDQALVPVGHFVNERMHVPPVTLPIDDTSESLVFELDTSTFPGNRVEHEIEVEIKAHSDAAGIEAALVRLLHEAGIEWHTAPSKAARFFAVLEKTTAD